MAERVVVHDLWFEICCIVLEVATYPIIRPPAQVCCMPAPLRRCCLHLYALGTFVSHQARASVSTGHRSMHDLARQSCRSRRAADAARCIRHTLSICTLHAARGVVDSSLHAACWIFNVYTAWCTLQGARRLACGTRGAP